MIDVTYPGVYIRDHHTEDRPIIGAPTSITAFVGRTPRGPVNQPHAVTSLSDYQRQFDGLNTQSTVSYMVRDFYLNGGDEAQVARMFEPYFPTPVVRRIAVAVGRSLAMAGATQTADIAATLAAVMAAIAQAGYIDPLEQGTAKRFLASLEGFAAAHPQGADKTDIAGALAAAEAAAAPQGASEVAISVPHRVAQATEAVADAAMDAAIVANSDAASVIRAAQTAANAQGGGASKVAAQAVVQALQSAEGAAYSAAFAVPAAIEAAVQITQDPRVSADDVATYQADAALIQQVQDASLVPASNAKHLLHLIRSMPPAFYHAVAQGVDEGTSAMDVALAATRHLTQQLVALSPDVFTLMAADPGTWGDRLTVEANRAGITQAVTDALSASLDAPLAPDDLFNLSVTYVTADGGTISEMFPNVTVVETGGPNRIDRVLSGQSQLLSLPKNDDGTAKLPASPPQDGAKGVGRGGTDSAPLSVETLLGDASQKTGIYALDHVDAFNILCIPPDTRDPAEGSFGDTPPLVYQTAAEFCVRRKAMLIIDPPNAWCDAAVKGQVDGISLSDLGSFSADAARSSVVYVPRLVAEDPRLNNDHVVFPASGAIAGIWASTDAQMGVWKAPAGLEAAFNGIIGPQAKLTDRQNGVLNPLGINCIRDFTQAGTVVWGARTMRGADLLQDEFRYIFVKRLALYVETSILQSTQWAVFEANDESLWSSLRHQVGGFMADLYKEGAFVGSAAQDAYAVTCDATTTTPADQVQGRVIIRVRFAPVRPAEYIVLTLSVSAGLASS